MASVDIGGRLGPNSLANEARCIRARMHRHMHEASADSSTVAVHIGSCMPKGLAGSISASQ